MTDKLYLPATLVLCLMVLFCWQRGVQDPARREILSMALETQREVWSLNVLISKTETES